MPMKPGGQVLRIFLADVFRLRIISERALTIFAAGPGGYPGTQFTDLVDLSLPGA
jgi:hypothetical protein